MYNNVSAHVTVSEIRTKLWLRVCLLNDTPKTPGLVTTGLPTPPRGKKKLFGAGLRAYQVYIF